MYFIKDPHTAMFVGQTGCGKTKLVLDLLEGVYRKCFEYIVIICPTLKFNSTYLCRKWIWDDIGIHLIEGKDCDLLKVIDAYSNFLKGCDTLFILDDVIMDERLDKRRSPFLELAISGRHRNHSLWILTQAYTCIQKNVRRQLKMLYVFNPNDRNELKLIHGENDVVGDSDFKCVKERLKESKFGCLVLRTEAPTDYKLLNC